MVVKSTTPTTGGLISMSMGSTDIVNVYWGVVIGDTVVHTEDTKSEAKEWAEENRPHYDRVVSLPERNFHFF